MVSPEVTRIWRNVPVPESPPDVCMRPEESEAIPPLPCACYQSFKIFERMRIRFCVCAYEYFSMVTEGVVHGVHKVVIRSSFGVIRRHKVS